MSCTWIEIETPDAAGRRRLRCGKCGVTTAPTAQPIGRVFGPCPDRKNQAPQTCQHRGADFRVVGCQSCTDSQQWKIKVFPCAVRGECAVLKQIDGVACCLNCQDFAPIETAPQ